MSDLIFHSSNVQYKLELNDSLLHVILHPANSISLDRYCITWSSFGIDLQHKNSYFYRLFGGDSSLSTCRNTTTKPIVIGLSKAVSGKIYSINMSDYPDKLYFFRDCFVLATDEIEISLKPWPLLRDPAATAMFGGNPISYMQKNHYFADGPSGLIFLQSDGEIMFKTLKQGESLCIHKGCLLGFDGKAVVYSHPTMLEFFKVNGPASVLLSAHNKISTITRNSNAISTSIGTLAPREQPQGIAGVIILHTLLYGVVVLLYLYMYIQETPALQQAWNEFFGNDEDNE